VAARLSLFFPATVGFPPGRRGFPFFFRLLGPLVGAVFLLCSLRSRPAAGFLALLGLIRTAFVLLPFLDGSSQILGREPVFCERTFPLGYLPFFFPPQGWPLFFFFQMKKGGKMFSTAPLFYNRPPFLQRFLFYLYIYFTSLCVDSLIFSVAANRCFYFFRAAFPSPPSPPFAKTFFFRILRHFSVGEFFFFSPPSLPSFHLLFL